MASKKRYSESATIDGKRIYFKGRTKKEVRAKKQEALERAAAGAPVRDDARPLADYLTQWTEKTLAVSSRSASTRRSYAAACRLWIVPTIGAVPLGQVKPNDADEVMLVMQDAGRASSTRRVVYDALSLALDDAVADGLIARHPLAASRKRQRPTPRYAEQKALSKVETARLVAGCEGRRYEPVVRFLLGTGMRRGEALGLRWADVDLDRGEASITGALVRSDGQLIRTGTKTLGSKRKVSLSASVLDVLRSQKAAQAAERLKAGSQWHDTGYVFTTALGKPVEPQNVLRTVREAAEKVALEDVKVHTLRHTYATLALEAGVPTKVVSTNLGHSSIQVTCDIYGHTSDEAARAGAEAVSAALGW